MELEKLSNISFRFRERFSESFWDYACYRVSIMSCKSFIFWFCILSHTFLDQIKSIEQILYKFYKYLVLPNFFN